MRKEDDSWRWEGGINPPDKTFFAVRLPSGNWVLDLDRDGNPIGYERQEDMYGLHNRYNLKTTEGNLKSVFLTGSEQSLIPNIKEFLIKRLKIHG